MKSVISFLCVFLVIAGPCAAEQRLSIQPPTEEPGRFGWFSGFKRNYTARELPPVDYVDSQRLESLMRAGRIYLSLQDAIALALENNLDIAVQRYGPKIAESDILRASAGQLLRGIGTNVAQGPSGAGGSGVLAGANAVGNGGGGGGASNGGLLSGINVQLAGSSIPNLDPIVFSDTYWGHATQPLSTSFTAATNSLVSVQKGFDFGIQKGFLTGTTVTYQWTNNFLFQNSANNDFNPSSSGRFILDLRQKLLQGFGLALNSRAIKVAKNNRHVSDLVFEEQVIVTVSNIMGLYWDLVTFNDNVKVQQQAVALAEKLYDDNKKQVKIGTLAAIEIVRAEAEVARSQQVLTDAETQVLQQETIIKNALSHNVLDSALAEARIVPTDIIRVPDEEAIEPIQDIYGRALQNRPEVEESQISLQNKRLNMKGTRSALLPSLDGFAEFANRGLAGQVNSLPIPPVRGSAPGTPFTPRDPSRVDAFFLGGYGTVLSQLFARNFPDYSVQLQLNIPLRNRSAQADYIRDQLEYRQQEISDRKLAKQIRVDVQNALIALQKARASYHTAVKARALQEQTLQAERKKYQLGASSILNVILVQRDLSSAQSIEVTARNGYARAKIQMENATGEILKNHEISLEEALRGVVSKPPGALPVLDNPGR